LTHGTNRLRAKQRVIVGTVVLAILAATLVPTRAGQLRPFSFCLACDFRWLADAVLNLGLFLPFGMAAAWHAKSFWKVAVAGALLSTAIELLQLVVPGRDPELRDILSNALGAVLGAALVYRPRAWLVAGTRRAAWLVGVTAVGIFAVIICTAALLSPARPTDPLRVSHVDGDAVVRYQSRADAIGLDQPAYYVEGMFAGLAPGPVRVDVSRRRTGWCLRFAATERCQVGPTLGRGWAVLVYPAAIAHRWADALVDVAWVAVLFFPLGFWTTRRAMALSVGALVLLLGALPTVVGLVPTTLGEWVGACVSVATGYAIAALVRRHLSEART
jgi:hypothetical protein